MVDNIGDLGNVLLVRHGDENNCFWLVHDGSELPQMGVLVKGELSSNTYLPQDGHAGFNSIGGVSGLKEGGSTRFSISTHQADDLECCNEFVLMFPKALDIAKEFFKSPEMPKSIEWFEL